MHLLQSLMSYLLKSAGGNMFHMNLTGVNKKVHPHIHLFPDAVLLLINHQEGHLCGSYKCIHRQTLTFSFKCSRKMSACTSVTAGLVVCATIRFIIVGSKRLWLTVVVNLRLFN